MALRSHLYKVLAGALLIIVTLSAGPTFGNPSTEPMDSTGVEKSVDKMSRKFWRGIVNVVTGVGEIPRQITLSCQKSGAGVGVPVGLLNGILMTPVRVGVGAFETATFLVPTMPDNHTPAWMSYGPILTPVFVWQSE